ncbi:hypothetical protein [Pleionea sediminis]|uniref:hypothetical protein n=1 Tax=Pleionea sediminis TaxID=2569479 RepID=UPI0011872439|nr:hypothetical protein [Pleionea sediminis]
MDLLYLTKRINKDFECSISEVDDGYFMPLMHGLSIRIYEQQDQIVLWTEFDLSLSTTEGIDTLTHLIAQTFGWRGQSLSIAFDQHYLGVQTLTDGNITYQLFTELLEAHIQYCETFIAPINHFEQGNIKHASLLS